jgi:hypothetical protein
MRVHGYRSMEQSTRQVDRQAHDALRGAVHALDRCAQEWIGAGKSPGMGERQGHRASIVSANGALIDVRRHHCKCVPHRGAELLPPV